MKASLLFFVFGVPLALGDIGSSGQELAPGEHEIRALIATHAAASVRGDLRGLVDVYHGDAVVRYSNGTILRGRAAIEMSYRESLSSNPTELMHSHPPETTTIRFLRPDVAFVDVESVSAGGNGSAGAVLSVARIPLFVVFTREQGNWGVAEQRSGEPLEVAERRRVNVLLSSDHAR